MMYEKVLVPLDGSKLAECVFPYVRELAAGGVLRELILLNVVEIPSAWVAEGIDLIDIRHLRVNSAQEYLADVQSRVSFAGVKAETEVMEGEPAHIIAEYAKTNGVNLIVIATHGYTGMKRLMFGSVALRVLHDAHIPVLLIRPESSM
ncbi:MAG: universal stress protein [Syntrophus sp. (in: bacteria)]|nr:universal stress protein [Syntrophus sp. (in: bacteria)]